MRRHRQAEKAKALSDLKGAIEAFLPVVRDTAELQHAAKAYEACVREAERLLANGLSQEDLASLARAVLQLFWLHKVLSRSTTRLMRTRVSSSCSRI